MSVSSKCYLGDGAYVQVGSWNGEVIITTENGEQITNRVHLDEQCTLNLLTWLKDHGRAGGAARDE